MAINKKKVSPIVKIGIILISVMLVLLFTLPLFSSDIFSGTNNSTSDGTTQGQLDAVAAKYAPTVQSYEQMLASEPTSYTVLVNLGNTYFDWAIGIQNAGGSATGAETPTWIAAAKYYDEALAVNSSDPNVQTDGAVAHYYSGDTAGAITLIEKVIKANPTFAIAYYNAGIFYRSASRTPDAVAAFNKYLELDPNDEQGNVAQAKTFLSELQSGSATTAP